MTAITSGPAYPIVLMECPFSVDTVRQNSDVLAPTWKCGFHKDLEARVAMEALVDQSWLAVRKIVTSKIPLFFCGNLGKAIRRFVIPQPTWITIRACIFQIAEAGA